MTGNRVEELEETVQELQATVSGLTDELIETKERLHVLEDHVGPELDETLTSSSSSSPSNDIVDADASTTESADAADEEAKSPDEKDEESAGSDDIIVA